MVRFGNPQHFSFTKTMGPMGPMGPSSIAPSQRFRSDRQLPQRLRGGALLRGFLGGAGATGEGLLQHGDLMGWGWGDPWETMGNPWEIRGKPWETCRTWRIFMGNSVGK